MVSYGPVKYQWICPTTRDNIFWHPFYSVDVRGCLFCSAVYPHGVKTKEKVAWQCAIWDQNVGPLPTDGGHWFNFFCVTTTNGDVKIQFTVRPQHRLKVGPASIRWPNLEPVLGHWAAFAWSRRWLRVLQEDWHRMWVDWPQHATKVDLLRMAVV